MLRTTSIIVACALGTSILAAAAMQSGQQRQQQPRQDRSTQQERDYDVETFEGKIVDLYHFMKANDEDRKNPESNAYNGKATGGPVALVVVRDRRILPDTEDVYIILGAPDETGRSTTRPGQQTGQQQQIQQQLEQSFTRLGIDQQRAQQQIQQLAQRIQREQPNQQELQEMIEQAFTRAGASKQRAQQEAQRIAPQIQRHVTGEGRTGQRPGFQYKDDHDDQDDQDDRDRGDKHQRTGEVPSNEICKSAMKMVGQTVRISGTKLERDNLQAIVARNIQSTSGETPADQRRDRDRDQDRDRDRDRQR